MKLEGNRALVTVAAGGMGRAIVDKLRQQGARVCVADRDTSGLEATAHRPGDLCDPAYANELPQAAFAALGGLDLLINNAAIMRRGPVTASTDEDFDLSFAVNVRAPFQICRAAPPVRTQPR